MVIANKIDKLNKIQIIKKNLYNDKKQYFLNEYKENEKLIEKDLKVIEMNKWNDFKYNKYITK
jgi:hypothetical protein